MTRSRMAGKIGGLTALLWCALAGLAQNAERAWDFPDFSATQVFAGAMRVSMKVYRRGSMVRVERSKAWSTLYDPANSKAYNLTSYPDGSQQCVVMKTSEARMIPSPLDLLNGSSVKRTAEGTETVEGHSCRVEKAVVTRPDGKIIESRVWEADDLKGVPVKIESQMDGGKLAAFYRDVVLETPDKALFEVPGRCTPIEKMGEVVEDKVVK
jgi:hypothetical protein